MPIDAGLQRYLSSWSDVLKLVGRPMLFLPFVVIGLIKMVALILIYHFWDPRISGFMAPALKSLAGDQVVHFPAHIQQLPVMFLVTEIFVMILLGFALVAWAAFMVADTLGRRGMTSSNYLIEVALATPSVAIIAVCFEGAAVGLPVALAAAAQELGERPKIQLILLSASCVAALLGTGLLLYSPCFLRATRGNAFSAIRRSVRFGRENVLSTALVAGTFLLLEGTLEFLAVHASSAGGGPYGDRVFGFLLARVLVGIFTWFYLVGAATSLITASERT
jgi:hypothetical protein